VSTRFKLTIGCIVVVLLTNAILAVSTVEYFAQRLVREVQTRVRMDLNSAHRVYHTHAERISNLLEAIAVRRPIESPLAQEVRGDLGRVLQKIWREQGIDMLTLVGPDGKVIYRAHNPDQSGDDLSSIPIVAEALREKKKASGVMILPADLLGRDGDALTRRARIPVKQAARAGSGEEEVSSDGMIIGAAVPFLSLSGDVEVLGVLFGSELLNRRCETVDTIKKELFHDQQYQGKDVGTSTVFMGDLRICTNVRDTSGARAIGTRLGKEVSHEVLETGKIWAGRAFVVNDWYITAYEPIRNPTGRIIGALYVGLLEEPYTQPQKVMIRFFLIMVSITTIASLVLLFFLSRMILKPIDHIVAMSRRVIGGDLSARVGICPPGEMGVLCKAIDHMADAVDQRERLLEEAARQQIGQSEKMASIGRLAAGIAHEINNPLTGVLTHAHMLRKKRDLEDQQKEDLDVVIRETSRVRDIVRGLLDFARQSHADMEPLDVNEVIRQTMLLLRSQKEFKKVTIEEDLAQGIPLVKGDKNQLQQVFLNLALNACEAMPVGGTLSVETSTAQDKVSVSVSDSGCGISPEDLGKIFDPFYTTKPVGKGTGLGLSVSYGIVEQHGGRIEVASNVGTGTTFTVILPVDKGGSRQDG
jgi:two-component system NtrC family sensor kinase